jgi:hypothetical protein
MTKSRTDYDAVLTIFSSGILLVMTDDGLGIQCLGFQFHNDTNCD